MTTKAYRAGRERGRNAGSWIIDGNTSAESAQRILQGFENGDPEIMDMQPNPLSGEWAGESISELSDQYGVDLHDDEKADQFEAGFSDGFWAEVQRSAKAALMPDGPTRDIFKQLEQERDEARADAENLAADIRAAMEQYGKTGGGALTLIEAVKDLQNIAFSHVDEQLTQVREAMAEEREKREQALLLLHKAEAQACRLADQRDMSIQEADALRSCVARERAQVADLLAALKDLRTRVVAEKLDCLNTTKADAAIACAEKGSQS